MFKYKVLGFILLTTVFISGKAYCQQEMKGQQVSTVSGKVDKIDVEGGVINVNTDNGTMIFYISIESDLFRSSHHIASIEIAKDDPVTIKYVSSPSGKNSVVRLEDNAPPSY